MEWNGIRKNILIWNKIWNGRFLVWNGYGMEEILQYGIWKNRLLFHSIACPAIRSQILILHTSILDHVDQVEFLLKTIIL